MKQSVQQSDVCRDRLQTGPINLRQRGLNMSDQSESAPVSYFQTLVNIFTAGQEIYTSLCWSIAASGTTVHHQLWQFSVHTLAFMKPPEQQSNDVLPSELQIIIVTIIVICLCLICFSFVLLTTKATFSNTFIAILVALASWTLLDCFGDFLGPRGDFWITVPAAICIGLLSFVQVRGMKNELYLTCRGAFTAISITTLSWRSLDFISNALGLSNIVWAKSISVVLFGVFALLGLIPTTINATSRQRDVAGPSNQ